MERRRRSIIKTISWRIIALIITTTITWIVTGSVKFAALIGGIDTLVKLLAYYYHERWWNRIPFGRLDH